MPAPRLETLVLSLLAQQLQRWENLLRQQNENGDTPSPQPLSAAPRQPPDHWAKKLNSHQPPAHWVAMVRQKAPGLLDGTGRGVIQARRNALTARPQTRLLNTQPDSNPPLDVVPAEAKEARVTSARPEGEQQTVPRPTLAFSVSEATPQTTPVYPTTDRPQAQLLMVYTPGESENPPPTAKIAQPPEAQAQRDISLRYGEAGAPAHITWSDSPRAESSPPPGLTINDMPPSASPMQEGENPPAVSAFAFPRYDEWSPLAAPPALTTESPSGLLSPSTSFPELEETSYFQAKDNQTESLEGMWPELPTPEAVSNADENGFMRVWKRRERLDREQRGMGWSEPLS
jgi:hypothetical protein